MATQRDTGTVVVGSVPLRLHDMRHHGLGSLHASTEKAHVAGLKPQVLAEPFIAVRVIKAFPGRSLHFALRRDGLGHLGRTLRLASRQPLRLDLVWLEFLHAGSAGVSTRGAGTGS